ncbi:YloV: DAK2 domain fusion protein YloV [Gaiella occulta]|uniref:YloV: DAK2 domain fusion protein YloV n=1 Tax=Gaiella occulta TaxID=1002870 RepID=A0A7M2YW66_9ACTN|nr:DAK2 domain-containing protein [Gaiella occulta]RDI73819.1 YloV: DAK2 domain fusion protein YloV [Gaiella occulta]
MNLDRAREIARAALHNLETNRRRIDDLNVYPVPDGDTGTNLTLTVRAIVEALDRSSADGHEAVARELSRAALMGARGNSGVIFSQIVRGFADVLAEQDEIDGPVVARAFRSASDAAYRAVRRPVEGTMLTVIREMAEEAELPEVRSLPKDELLARVVAHGEDALRRTPEMLPVLAEAGVVDAGGAGLVEIIRGLRAAVAGEELPDAPAAGVELSLDAVHRELSRYRYCTVFVVEGEELDAGSLERELERIGDSLLVVGDATALKVHVHSDDPGAVLTLATQRGEVEGVEIANMHRQTVERGERLAAGSVNGLPTLETGVVVVAPGEGNRRLFESMRAARVIEGGQTMNPSTADIVAAVDATPATEVIVLPNNKNVILSAEQAAALAGKPVRVVPTCSVQAGLAAMVAYDPERSAAENEETMRDAQAAIAAGEVTVASRDVELDGVDVRRGAWLGLADGAAVASGDDFVEVAWAVVERLLDGGRGLLTLLTGADAPPLADLLERIGTRHPEVEVETHEGGQPHYPLLLSAE